MREIDAIRDIQAGDEPLREQFISSRREFIRRYASFVCRRSLDWRNDDELSVALISFNRALNSFDPSAGKSFAAYARLVIRNSLIDHIRHRAVGPTIDPLAIDDSGSDADAQAALRRYELDRARADWAVEVERLRELLAGYTITLDELAAQSPRHRDTREHLKSIACQIAERPEIIDRIRRTQRLPVLEIQAVTGVRRKLLERWRKYLVSLIIILTDADLEYLAEYIWGKRERVQS